jgi:hypothetical protein
VRHQGADGGLIDFAKQAFGAQNASEIGFNFIETNAAAEELPPTPPPRSRLSSKKARHSKTPEKPPKKSPAAGETLRSFVVAEVQVAQLPASREKATMGCKFGHRGGRHNPQCASLYRGCSRARFCRHRLWNEPLECHAYNQARSRPDKGRPTLAGARSRHRARLRQDFDLVYEH